MKQFLLGTKGVAGAFRGGGSGCTPGSPGSPCARGGGRQCPQLSCRELEESAGLFILIFVLWSEHFPGNPSSQPICSLRLAELVTKAPS